MHARLHPAQTPSQATTRMHSEHRQRCFCCSLLSVVNTTKHPLASMSGLSNSSHNNDATTSTGEVKWDDLLSADTFGEPSWDDLSAEATFGEPQRFSFTQESRGGQPLVDPPPQTPSFGTVGLRKRWHWATTLPTRVTWPSSPRAGPHRVIWQLPPQGQCSPGTSGRRASLVSELLCDVFRFARQKFRCREVNLM